MQIGSWNVNSVRTRLDQVLRWLEQQQPDLLCLQETKVDDPLFPVQAFENAGWRVSMHGQKAYNGVAMVSRAPLEDVRCGFLGHTSPFAPMSPNSIKVSKFMLVMSLMKWYVEVGGIAPQVS